MTRPSGSRVGPGMLASGLVGVGLAILVAGALPAAAAEIRGKVTAVTGRDVRIEVEGDLLPQLGDPVRLSFRIPGGPEVGVGQWRVSAVDAGGVQATMVQATGAPTVGQMATIESANPTRRRGAAMPLPGGASPAPGPSAPSPFARRVSIVMSPLLVGPLLLGSGRVEQVGPAYVVVSSPGLATWKPISREPAQDFYATIRARVERGSNDPAVVGLILSADASDFNEGDLFFGKVEGAGLLVQTRIGGQWTPHTQAVPAGPPMTPGDVDRFEVTRRGGRYELRANGHPLAAFDDASPRPKWVQVFAGAGNRAEFFDWGVERPE